MLYIIILLTSKKDSKKSQPKRPNQNGQVQNDLFKMAPWSSWIEAIWGSF